MLALEGFLLALIGRWHESRVRHKPSPAQWRNSRLRPWVPLSPAQPHDNDSENKPSPVACFTPSAVGAAQPSPAQPTITIRERIALTITAQSSPAHDNDNSNDSDSPAQLTRTIAITITHSFQLGFENSVHKKSKLFGVYTPMLSLQCFFPLFEWFQ